MFIGYHSNQKGYKLFDLETKQVFLSRDVVFCEDVFPFKSADSSPPINTHISNHPPIFAAGSSTPDDDPPFFHDPPVIHPPFPEVTDILPSSHDDIDNTLPSSSIIQSFPPTR